MSGSRLLLGSSLTDRTLLPVDGQPAILQHERLRALLAERAPRAAEMFAEPWADAKDGQPIARVSWYAKAGEDPVAFEALPTSQRLAAENALRGRLADLVPLFQDPEAGPLLRAALSLPGRGDILWNGDAPVLVNWGVVPAQVGEDPAALARHFAEVFRDLVPGGANPWGASRPAAPEAAAVGAGAAVAAGAAMAAAGAGGGAPPPPPPVMPPQAGEPGWRRPMSGATAILAATAIVLLVSAVALAAGFYYGWVQLSRQIAATAPVPRDPAFDADLRRIQEGVNDGLRRRLAQLETALRGDICVAPDGPLPAAPLRQGEAPPRGGMSPIPALPPAPDQQPVQRPQSPPGAPPVPGAGQATNLADLLEDSTVLILAPIRSPDGRQGLSTGSGFAIAPDIVVTNLHVVDDATPGNLFVVNRKLGKPVEAEVIARTPNHDFGKPDFAVLKLKEGQLPPLALSPTADRLLPVVAVGFPGFVTQVGDDFQRLLRGEDGAMPAAHFTSGEVAGVQTMQGAPVVIHTAAINRGNSGGPLADRCGRIVGVNTFIRTDRETAYRADYALPSVTLLAFLQQNNVAARSEDNPCTPAAPSATPAPAAPAPAPAAPAPAAPAAPAAPR
jgi:S1-C subfamily serine protease